VNALPVEEQNGKGRISLIIWGKNNNVIEEKNSPPMVINAPPGAGFGHRPRTEGDAKEGGERVERPKTGTCHQFVRNGHCRYGKDCRYAHT